MESIGTAYVDIVPIIDMDSITYKVSTALATAADEHYRTVLKQAYMAGYSDGAEAAEDVDYPSPSETWDAYLDELLTGLR